MRPCGGCTSAGVRGVRFNMVSGNGTPEDQLQALARRIAPLGWHIQVYAEGDKLEAMAPILAKLPVEVVIDHCGGVMAELGTGHSQFQALLRLLGGGRAWIKLSSYRASSAGAPWTDMAPNVRALAAAAAGTLRVGHRLAAPEHGPGAGGRRAAGPVHAVGAGCRGAATDSGGQSGAAVRVLIGRRWLLIAGLPRQTAPHRRQQQGASGQCPLGRAAAQLRRQDGAGHRGEQQCAEPTDGWSGQQVAARELSGADSAHGTSRLACGRPHAGGYSWVIGAETARRAVFSGAWSP